MTIDKKGGSHAVITGPSGSIRGHRNRVIRSIQKIGGHLSSAPRAGPEFSSCSSSASDTESESSSSSFFDSAVLSFTHSSASSSSSESSAAVLSFEAEDSDVIRSLRDKWQRKKKHSVAGSHSSGCSTIRSDEEEDEKTEDRVVLYTTSIGVIRSTFEASNKLRAILDQNFIRFEERDLFLDETFRRELKHKFSVHHIQVPCVFVNGVFFGSVEEIEAMNEAGILRHILPSMASLECEANDDLVTGGRVSGIREDEQSEGGIMMQNRTHRYTVTEGGRRVCGGCGGARFIPCMRCNGSTKSCVLRFPTGRHSIVSLKCTECSRGTGLIRCPLCFPATHSSHDLASK